MSAVGAGALAPAADVARDIGVPREAIELARDAEIVDLHLESFIPPRLWGYDLRRRNRSVLGGRFFGHLDIPRALEGGLGGAMWSIATNVARWPAKRFALLEENAARLRATLLESGAVAIVRSRSEYDAARAAGKHAAMLSVQGGNAYEGAPDVARALATGDVVRVTVVHLTSSRFGETSSPLRLRSDAGLTREGRAFVEALDAARVFVDLAHASPATFWDAVEAHDRALPLIVTHTGASEVHDVWRNIDARQIAAVADSGGVVGVIFHHPFLGGAHDGRRVLDHVEAVIRAGGEDAAALGSDYDGAILPPPDLRDGASAYYRLVAYMLERRWTEERIRRVLGRSFLASLARLRP